MSRALTARNTFLFACLFALVGLLLLPAGSNVASAKKPSKPTPTPTPVPEPADPEIVYMSETLSKNKKNVTYKIMLMDSDGSNKTTVRDCGPSYCANPTFSADGSKIIFVSEEFAPNQAIYIMDIDGSNVLELAELHNSSGQPEMSPVPIGGQYWIFYSDYGPYEDIYAVNEDGEVVQVTFTTEYTERAPAFSADGLWFSADMYPHQKPWEGHVFHFELDQTADYPLVIWEAATVYDIPCYQSHASWSPILGDYRFMVNCDYNGTYLYDFGPLPWYYEVDYCELVGDLEWCRDHIYPTNWPDDPLNLTESGADYGNAEFSPDALQYVYENNNTIYRANIDKDGLPTALASSSRWTTVYAPDWRPKPAGFLGKLTASDAADGDRFGLLFGTQAIYGDTAVIGAYLDDHGDETDAGSAYVFTRSGDAWREQQKIIGSDTEGGDAFGGSSAVSEDTVFISAIWDDHSGFVDAGSVYVYSRSAENTFVEKQILTAQYPAHDDWFGWVLAVDGDTLVVGSGNWQASDETGSAHVFTYSEITDTWSWQADLTASDGAPNDVFGQSVIVAGDTIVVGAPLADRPGLVNAGAAYVYTRSGETWSEKKLMASDAEAGDCFGTFVAISDDTIMVSAQWDNEDAGSVYVFTRSGNYWVEQQKITASDGGAGDWFGDSTVLSGDTAIISAIHNDSCGYQDAGAVYIFARSDGIWSEQRKITAGDADDGDELGWGIPAFGDIVLMGAAMDDHSGLEDAGSVYVYRLIPTP